MADVQDDDQITPMHTCSQCQKTATFMCSSCSHDGPRYCSVECQKVHWTEGHYRNCTAAKRTRQLHRQAVETSLRIESTSTF
jgi:hypothetical protein